MPRPATARSARTARGQRATVEALPRREQAARQRSLSALALMRRKGLALTTAAAAVGASVETVQKYTRSALRQSSNGRYRPTKADRLYRPVEMQTVDGPVTIHTTHSGVASMIASHRSAIGTYATTGDNTALNAFKGQSIRSGGRIHRFLTSTTDIEDLINAGELNFEGLYQAPH